MEYIRLAEGLKSYKLIPTTDDIWDHITSPDSKDYYLSIYKYNEEHYNKWKTTKTLSGVKDVYTTRLVFDFDSKDNLDMARQDATALVARLMSYGVNQDNIQTSFSGSKGFCVEVDTDKKMTPPEFKAITSELAKNLKTYDSVVSDANRIVRVLGTKHQKSGLLKIPLSVTQLSTLPIDSIISIAKSWDNVDESVMSKWVQIPLPETIYAFKNKKVEKEKAHQSTVDISDFDLSKKPKWLSSQKFALQEGFFGPGERNQSFMILASTYKNQGFSQELVYRMLKGVAEKQAIRNNMERYSNEELWNNITRVVFSPGWNGGTYSVENTKLLQDVSERMGLKSERQEENQPKSVSAITDKFKVYVKNIEKNTIKTGIESLDKRVFLSTGANVSLLGAPGSGKSSLALEILSNTSKQGIKSVFASLDMASTRIYEKILYRLTGKRREDLYQAYKTDKEDEFVKLMQEEFGNVYFFDKTSPSVQDLKQYIRSCEEHSGEKIKLVVIDYFERLSSEKGDDTAASKDVAGQLQDLVNDLDICLITLVQPNKMSGDMSEPIFSYTNIKGSSFLAQSFRIIFGIYREGYDPKHPEDDRFLTINILKNDLGEPASIDYFWEGKRGKISEIDWEGQKHLEAIRKAKAAEKDNKDF